MRGRLVSGGREAVIAVTVLDTGFTGNLTLPSEVLRSLSLPGRGFVEVELADGSDATLEVFEARILWHERTYRVPVYEAGGNPLVGMSLLNGGRSLAHKKLSAQIIDGLHKN